MSRIWDMIEDPTILPSVVRVYRWLHQWPEAIAWPTIINPSEISAAANIDIVDVLSALEYLEAEECIAVAARRPDGCVWMRLLQGRRPDLGEPEMDTVIPKPPREKRAVHLGLRWDILERDGHKCCGCGATVADGAKLVIDHVKPFSKGGRTVKENLQTLCSECNVGKADKFLALA